VILSALGLLVLLMRLGPAIFRKSHNHTRLARSDKESPSVSVIIPARNEETNLPTILTSLVALTVQEIIIINDHSEDRTREIAQRFADRDARVRVIDGEERPEGWTGKNWACQQGALISMGDYLLFTDADTEHLDGSLERVLSLNANLASAIPYHSTQTWMEKLLGPFHMLVFISSSAFLKPKPKSLFAIGQYLLFQREWYFAQGMHEAVKGSLADDLDLAERCLQMGGNYQLETSGEIFKVRMYDSFAAFVAGWRRIFRVGFQHANLLRVVEVFAIISCLTESFRFAKATPQETLCAVAGLVLIALAQRRYGQFSLLGAILAPIGIGTFVYVSAAALLDRILGRDLRWRGRSYKLSS
jgi:glycosyltransferase involved in cell wall biosynthesis